MYRETYFMHVTALIICSLMDSGDNMNYSLLTFTNEAKYTTNVCIYEGNSRNYLIANLTV